MTDLGYVLSTTTNVSQKDLRTVVTGIIFKGKEYFAIGDRSNLLYLFNYNAETNAIKLENSFQAHDGWVSALAYHKPCDEYPNGAIITGSHDKLIKIWDFESVLTNSSTVPNPLQTYAHDAAVCFIHACNDGSGRIISSGWDSTCRIWKGKSEEASIILHHETFAIWSASSIPGGYITCGADQTIRIWTETGEHVKTIQDAHDCPIRDCVYIPSRKILVTCANDGLIKEWKVNDLSLENLTTITCTNVYLYSICLLDDDTYIVSSEDKCAYIASSKTKKVQDMLLAPDTVWVASTFSNKDIICCSADGVARTFTNDPARRCDNSIETEYLQKLASIPNSDLKEVNPLTISDISKLGPDDIQIGNASIARKDHQLVLCTWSKGYNKWIQIGTYDLPEKYQKMVNVTDDQGNHWDYCFPIELEDGQTFSLYTNSDTDEYATVFDFMNKNNLDPKVYLAQIISCINRFKDTDNSKPPFPMKGLSYFKENDTKYIFNSIKSLNESQKNEPILTEDQLNILQKPLSHDLFEIIEKLIFNWQYDQLVPVLDFLRILILDPKARDFIPASNMVKIIQHLEQVDPDQSSEPLIVMILQVIVNMFLNYTGEILTEVNVFEIISKFADRFSTSEQQMQISFSTLIHNYSTLLCLNQEMCIELMVIIIDILTPELDQNVILKLLSACGNLAFFSDEAKLKLQLYPYIIQDLISEKLSTECIKVLTNVVNLISSSS